jgi:uncharacterized protein (DUF362 family)
MPPKSQIEVALSRCPSYESSRLPEKVGLLFETIQCRPSHGTRILVKPNLLAPSAPDHLPCTHPLVVRAICRHLLDLGATVRVGDSPTFGNAVEISGKIGLTEALADLPVTVVNLDRLTPVRLSFGGWMAISPKALENDLIVSVPKLKAHHQMRITGAVKNAYGCVPGLCKPLFHLFYGDRDARFERLFLEIWENLPPSVSLMDAIVSMHVHGPIKGQPYPLGLLAASTSAVALDTAIMGILGLEPEETPLWRIALNLNMPGASLEDLVYPLDSPDSFGSSGFKTPEHLLPMSFRPLRVIRHYWKRLCG